MIKRTYDDLILNREVDTSFYFFNDQLKLICCNDQIIGLGGDQFQNIKDQTFSQVFSLLGEQQVNNLISLFKSGNFFSAQVNIGERTLDLSAHPVAQNEHNIPFWLLFLTPATFGVVPENGDQEKSFITDLADHFALPVYLITNVDFTILSLSSADRLQATNIVGNSILEFLSDSVKEDFLRHFFLAADDRPVDLKLPSGGKYFQIRMNLLNAGTENHRQVLIHISDESKWQKNESSYRHRLEFGRLSTHLAMNLINCPDSAFDQRINEALEKIGQFSGVDRCYIFNYSKDENAVYYDYEWCQKGINAQKDVFQKFSIQELPWFWEKITRHDILYIPVVNQLPPEAEIEKEIFHQQGIKSLLAVPMWSQDQMIGFVGFDAVNQVKHWHQEEIELLKILGEIFMSGLIRRNVRRKLTNTTKDYQALFENAHDAILVLDPDTEEILDFNPMTLQIYGYTREEMLGKSMETFTKDVSKGKFLIEELRRTGKVMVESVHFHRNGLPMFLEITGSLVTYRDKEAILSINRDVTQKKLHQKALNETKERFRQISELTSDYAYALKVTGNSYQVEWFSRSFYLNFHIDAEFLKNFVELVHPSDRDLVQDYFNKLLVSYDSMEFEYRVIDKNGDLRWFNNISKPIWDMEQSKVFRIMGAARDITDKKNSIIRLQQKDEKYKTLFNNAGDFYFIHDAEGKIIEVNDIACRKLAWKREKLLQKPLGELVAPDKMKFLNLKLQELINKERLVFESILLSRRGNEIPVEINAKVIPYEGSQAILSVARDISARKKTQKLLKNELKLNFILSKLSKELLSTNFSIEQISQKVLKYALFVTDSRHGFVGQTDNYTQVGVASLHHRNKVSYSILNQDNDNSGKYLEELKQFWNQGLKTRSAYLNNNCNIDQLKTGRSVTRFSSFLSVPALIEQKIHGQIAVAKSGEKYNEKDLKALERVAHFYALALQKRKAEEELKKRNSELNNFVYKVSHDLRSPLSSMHGLINLIKISDNEGDKSNYFKLIENRILKLDSFIREILSHSKNLNTPVVISKIDLPALIHDAMEDLKYLKGHSRLKLELEIDQEDFYSDAIRLFEVFRNLISNSIKYMQYDQQVNLLQIKIRFNENKVMISVSDNGIGIDKSFQHRIFDMFFKGTDKSDGSGIGLYIVNQTLEKLGGTISVDSEKGKGSCFHISLPNARPA